MISIFHKFNVECRPMNPPTLPSRRLNLRSPPPDPLVASRSRERIINP